MNGKEKGKMYKIVPVPDMVISHIHTTHLKKSWKKGKTKGERIDIKGEIKN
jgi:hypothetical protein